MKPWAVWTPATCAAEAVKIRAKVVQAVMAKAMTIPRLVRCERWGVFVIVRPLF